MFAPPHPPARPTSALSHRSFAASPAPVIPMPSPSPIQQQQIVTAGLQRRNSLTWNKDAAGLPPPPSEIDNYGDISDALLPGGAVSSAALRHHHMNGYHPERGIDAGLDYSERDSRQQAHMNTVVKHPKVKVEVVLSSNIFEAGGTISGRLELACATSQKLRLGEIAVELEGTEELTSRDHAATQMFLYNRTMFQGEHLPPSNAVLPAAPNQGYWAARKGRTTFPFNFRLPKTAPSSVTFAGNASLRYSLKATVQVSWEGERTLVTSRKDAFVVEKWEDEHDEKYAEPREAIGDTRLFMGGAGQVWLEAGVSEQLFWGGGSVMIRCGVKNSTKRHVSGIRVGLARRLIFPVGHSPTAEQSLQPQITDIVHQENFKGPTFEFPPNHEAVFNVSVDIPRDLRTIRKTRLFEVRCIALVSVLMGTFAKDLTVEIPIFVAHTASVQKAAQANLAPLHGQQQMDAQLQAVQQLALERGWSPAPVAPPARPGSAMSNMIALPALPQPFVMADPAAGQLAWDPQSAQAWSASQLNVHGVQPIARPASAHQFQRSMSAGPELQSQLLAMQQGSGIGRPTSAMSVHAQQQLAVANPHARDATAGSTHLMHLQGQGSSGSVRRASAPVLSQLQIHQQQLQQQQQGHPGMHSPAPPTPQPQLQQPQSPHSYGSASPVVEYSPSPATYQPIATPLPPPQPAVPQGLATITEDSESQAGTVKSVHAMKVGTSVSKKDVDAFEKMAAKLEEEDPEEVKAALASAGLEWDEEEEERLRKEKEEKEQAEAAAAAAAASAAAVSMAAIAKASSQPSRTSTTSSSKKEEAAVLMNSRPRASDIFNQAQQQAKSLPEAREEPEQYSTLKRSPQPIQPVAVKAQKAAKVEEPRKSRSPVPQQQQEVAASVTVVKREPSPNLPAPPASEQRRRSLSPSPGGQGLFALESRLSRPSSPAAPAEPAVLPTSTTSVPSQARKPSASPSTRSAALAASPSTRSTPLESATPIIAMANVAPAESKLTEVSRPAPAKETASTRTVTAPVPSVKSESRSKVPQPVSKTPAGTGAKWQEVEQRQLRSTAVNRVGDWLSQTASPPGSTTTVQQARSVSAPTQSALPPIPDQAAYVDSPKTPASSAFVHEDQITASRFEKLVESAAQKYPVADEPKPKPLRVVSYDAKGSSPRDPDAPTISAGLRALIDNAQPSGQRKSGNVLKDHPIARRLSVNGDKQQEGSESGSPKPGLPVESSKVRRLSQSFASREAKQEAAGSSDGVSKSPRPGKATYTSSPGFQTLIHRPVLKANTAGHFLNKAGTQGVFSKETSPTTSSSSNSDKKVPGDEPPQDVEPKQAPVSAIKPAAVTATSVSITPAQPAVASRVASVVQPSAIKSVGQPSAVQTSSYAPAVKSTVPAATVNSSTTTVRPSAVHPQSSAALLRGSSNGSAVASRQAKFLAALAKDEEPSQSIASEVSKKTATLDPPVNSAGGRGTTKAIGKNKMADLRSIWGA